MEGTQASWENVDRASRADGKWGRGRYHYYYGASWWYLAGPMADLKGGIGQGMQGVAQVGGRD